MRSKILGSLSALMLLALAGTAHAGAAWRIQPSAAADADRCVPGWRHRSGEVRFPWRSGVQPGFKFSNAPATTVTYAIIFHDIDVALQGGTDDVLHWLAWNIPASANGIPEGKLPEGSVTGKNITGQNTYMGPGAPPGPRLHHYVFELYALNAKLDLPDTATRADVLAAMKGKTVAKAAYVGRYVGPAAPAAPAPAK